MTPAWPLSTLTALGAPVANHLWQSTLCAAAAGLLTLTLSHHRAQVRHAIWLAASMKFLVPFAALLALGRAIGWPSSLRVQPDLALDAVSEPFSQPLLRVAATAPATNTFTGVETLSVLLLATWAFGCAALLLTWWVRWRRVERMAEHPGGRRRSRRDRRTGGVGRLARATAARPVACGRRQHPVFRVRVDQSEQVRGFQVSSDDDGRRPTHDHESTPPRSHSEQLRHAGGGWTGLAER